MNINEFNTEIAVIMSKIAWNFETSELFDMSLFDIRDLIVNIGKDAVTASRYNDFCNVVAEISNYKIQSLKVALMEYASVLH